MTQRKTKEFRSPDIIWVRGLGIIHCEPATVHVWLDALSSLGLDMKIDVRVMKVI